MDIEKLLEKVKNFSEKDKVDLSSQEDLAIGIMNLIGIEEHLIFTYEKTKSDATLQLLNEVRIMRTELLAKIVKNPKGEIWCISKHFLASSMRLMEVGTKKTKEGKLDEAKEMFNKAYSLWNMFWGLNLGLVDAKDAEAMEVEKDIEIKNENQTDPSASSLQQSSEQARQALRSSSGQAKLSPFEKLGKAIEKILDCCRE